MKSSNFNSSIRFTCPGASVLIVDDLISNLYISRELLSSYELQIDICASGKEAVEASFLKEYDIIFMDHLMPEMNGIEAGRIIRARAKDSGLKNPVIIALTANAAAEAEENFLKNGFDDFLFKPIDILKLNDILEKWIPENMKIRNIGASYEKKEGSGTADKMLTKNLDEDNLFIDGVDVKSGISMMGRKFSNYMRVLKVFYDDGFEKIETIRESHENNDIESLTISVHAVKSSSAAIGAAAFSSQAKALENAGHNKDLVFISANIASFLDNFKILLNNIGGAINNQEP